MAPLYSLYDSPNYSRIVKSILGSHNLGIPRDQIISNLRNKISSQQISNEIDRLIFILVDNVNILLKILKKKNKLYMRKNIPTSL